MTRTRRGAALIASALAAALLLAGCGAGEPDTDSTDAASGGNTGGDAFPVTIDAAYGEVSVKEKPERIFVFSARNLELLSYLGEEPYVFNNGPLTGEEFLERLPYLDDALTTEPDPSLYDMGEYSLDAEAIAAFEPDLILADVWNVDEQAYQQLAQIAPTFVGLKAGDWTSWQDTLTSFATLTGHDPDAALAEVEAELDTAFETAADRLPGLQGATYQVVTIDDEGFGVGPFDDGVDVDTRLGLVAAKGYEEGRQASWENVDTLSADVLFVGSAGSLSDEAVEEGFTRLREDPRFAELPAVKNGAVVWLTRDEVAAITAVTPGGLTWWLEQTVPRLEESALNQSAQ
ncbi:ABC transporter substrate-binding protein [Microbacterium sp.]|uniref:ABC transporter substrate-binding protein n=1 Tax=Microbacterium sp. TaxID=51671 RepID=UPI003C70AA61